MAPVPALRITFGRSPRARALGFLVMGSALVVSWKWDSLSWHARGLILAAYGVAGLGFGLNQVLDTRGLLKSGARTRGTVVDADEDTSQDDDGRVSTTYAPVV